MTDLASLKEILISVLLTRNNNTEFPLFLNEFMIWYTYIYQNGTLAVKHFVLYAPVAIVPCVLINKMGKLY